ncbi:MAG: DeoR family transcriptional regulator [Exilibacterium sp.]
MSANARKTKTAEARHDAIVTFVKQQGFVPISLLAEQLNVTVQTIRRDVNQLSDEGKISRFHGGVGLPSSVENIKGLNMSEKNRVANLVAQHIAPHSSLFINIGTTTETVARELLQHEDLRFITNNLNVATLLNAHSDFEVVVAGGKVRSHDGGIVGQTANDMISQFRVDYAVIGISGIDDDGTLLDYDHDEVRATQTIISNARQVFLVADHTKFSRRPMVRAGSITQVSALFTDRLPPEPIVKILKAHNVKLHVPDKEPTE